MTKADYDELGGVAKSLTNRANDEYDKLVEKDNAYSQTIRNVMGWWRLAAVSWLGNKCYMPN